MRRETREVDCLTSSRASGKVKLRLKSGRIICTSRVKNFNLQLDKVTGKLELLEFPPIESSPKFPSPESSRLPHLSLLKAIVFKFFVISESDEKSSFPLSTFRSRVELCSSCFDNDHTHLSHIDGQLILRL